MANAGDFFITTLKDAHLKWGSHRHTNTRGVVYGEGYLQVPRKEAKRIGIYNSNYPGQMNILTCSSVDGFLRDVEVKASGSSEQGDEYAKQLQGNGDLQLFGKWFNHIDAQVGDRVRVTWISSTAITVEKIC
ncbi:hypothetical protein [Bacillus cereus]|uniref:hypothetical protein n=1 Tax=Bacillus cereus group TaxID=86661 RepID=UPI000278FCB9|nr:hypothetical protein [Bacillus cereus]EJQ04154.1 hypothetical protein IE1_04558 [Bacillus cereus BAG3O-2]EJQ31986.1 hypothetical protein IE7_00771 [Bacillus cereus BAG4O-1]PEW37797.1 hypothetical protein CN436_26165 [Bacillus cereus]TNO64609.1 hypothetical protein FHR06_20080 [Bacillus cereus]HDR8365019.1 hypothetical protein [Bacillus cereus]